MNMKTASLFALGILLLASGAWADTPIYKWVDAQGVVHYSTEPHGDGAQQTKIINSGNSLPNVSTAPLPVAATGAGAAGASDDATLVAPQPADSPACKAGRDRLSQYLHADRLYQIDDKGQKVVLSSQDKAKALDDARNYVRQACSPGGGQ